MGKKHCTVGFIAAGQVFSDGYHGTVHPFTYGFDYCTMPGQWCQHNTKCCTKRDFLYFCVNFWAICQNSVQASFLPAEHILQTFYFCCCHSRFAFILSKATPHNSRLAAQAPLRQLRHGICVAKMLDNVGLRYPHRASGAKAPRTLRPLPLLRFAVSSTGGAHLCSIQYYLRFWLGICRASLAVSALRIMRYCPWPYISWWVPFGSPQSTSLSPS